METLRLLFFLLIVATFLTVAVNYLFGNTKLLLPFLRISPVVWWVLAAVIVITLIISNNLFKGDIARPPF